MSDNITTASAEDLPALRDLYAAAFHADESELERFFSIRFVPEETLVFRRDGELLAALYLWYGELVCAGQRYSADYIYAAATHADARRQGIMAQLIEAAAELSRIRGRKFLVLSPAGEKLYTYYGKLGFATAFFSKELTLKRDILSLIADNGARMIPLKKPPSAEAIHALRETLFVRADGFSWNAAALAYAVADLADGGHLLAIADGDSLCAYSFLYEDKNGAFLAESVAQPGALPALAAEILRLSPADLFRFVLPPDFPLSAEGFILRPTGMIRPLTPGGEQLIRLLRNAYLGLTMA
ncbi:MAG: GNAT family N-acetyltransferase [Oscillospiraceae bacterium]|nr:GNAT family N-acetyltransferase [Oscillospiraceae bacterium]